MSTFFTSIAKGTGLRGIELLKEYEGPYDAKGKRHGKGTYRYANHCTYEGMYEHGLKHGDGKLTFTDGGYYEGKFVKDEIQGDGLRFFANGNIFVGSFEKGEMNGKGSMTFANGDVFEGTVVRNVFEGKGMYRKENGDMYIGNFTGHKMTGRGVMQYACGDRYDGDWVAAKRCGKGACAYKNRDLYSGEWADDLKHGEGKLVVATTEITYEGKFIQGVPSQIPKKMNGCYLPSDTGKGAKKPAKGVVEEATPMAVVLGQPIPTPIHVLAQLQVPTPPPDENAPAPTPPVKGAPPPPPEPIITEPAAEGCMWETAEMESGRVAHVSLHVAAPSPLPAGNLIGCTLLTTSGEYGAVRVKVVLNTMSLGPSVPLLKVEDEPIHALELVLRNGKSTLADLTLGGAPEVDEAMQAGLTPNGGKGYLVFSSWGLLPGYMCVAVPPAGKAKK